MLLGTAALVTVHPTTPPAAAAAEPESFVRIRLQRLEPALPTRDGRIALTAEVTNTSDGELTNLQAYFWRSLDPIEDGEGMTAALKSAANEPIGARKGDYRNFPSETDRTLEPGESAQFTVSVDVATLELPSSDGVYLMGAQVRGRTVVNGPQFTLGRVRVFVPVVDTSPPTSRQITSVVILGSRPSLLRDDLLIDDHLAEEVAEGGRLRALLAAADSLATSFAVDPAVIETLQRMKAGYVVQGADNAKAPGTGAADAARWLSDFEDLLAERDGYRLLYGGVDAAALVHADQAPVLGQAAAASRALALTRRLPLLALPAGGQADRRTVTALAKLNPAAIVLSDASVRTAGPLLEGPGGTPVVRYTASASSGGGPGPSPRNTPIHLQQRFLADTWLEAAAAPPGSTVGRVRLITSAASARSADQAVRAPWLKSSTLTELLRGKPSDWKQRYRYPAASRARELDDGHLAAVAQLAADSATYEDLLGSSEAARLDGDAAVALAASGSFRRSPRAGREFTAAQQDQVDAVLRDGLEITVTKLVVTSGRSGVFPVTVRNTAEPDPADPNRNAVRGLRLTFESTNSQRLTVAPIEVPGLAAGDSITADARVEAKANGTVRVTARLYTQSEKRVGEPEAFDVRATQAGTTGWFIAVAAGLVLVGTTALRIRQVARERSQVAADDAAPSGDPGPLSSAPPMDGPSTGSGHGPTDSGGVRLDA